MVLGRRAKKKRCETFFTMNNICTLLLVALCVGGCSSNFQTVGLVNNTDKEITIVTYPNLHYGDAEKSIGLEKDSSNRGQVWKVGSINCIVVHPMGSNVVLDSIGEYIMKPESAFRIGYFYKPKHIHFTEECLQPEYIKVMTSHDTVVLNDRKAIWSALNYDKRVKRNRKIIFDKAILVN